jgi:hypothetical protein
LVVLFKGHLYLHHTFSSCCIFNAIFSISAQISLSSLSISAFIFCGQSSPRPSLWPSIAIFLHLQPTWSSINSIHRETISFHLLSTHEFRL